MCRSMATRRSPRSARGAGTVWRSRRCSGPAASRTAAPTRASEIARVGRGRRRGRCRRRPGGRPAGALLRRPRRVPRARRPRRHEWCCQRAVVRRQCAQPGRPGVATVRRGRVRLARRHCSRRRGCTPAATSCRSVRRVRRRRSAPGRDSASFLRAIVELIVSTTGRQVGVWQEAAEAGALHPDDGYVVGWKSAADCRRLAADGFHVVASPAEVYYLDMAADADWHSPGMSWAGSLVRGGHRSVRRDGRLVGDGAGEPARGPGVPVDRARPRPTRPRTTAVPTIGCVRRVDLVTVTANAVPDGRPAGDRRRVAGRVDRVERPRRRRTATPKSSSSATRRSSCCGPRRTRATPTASRSPRCRSTLLLDNPQIALRQVGNGDPTVMRAPGASRPVRPR